MLPPVYKFLQTKHLMTNLFFFLEIQPQFHNQKNEKKIRKRSQNGNSKRNNKFISRMTKKGVETEFI